MAGEKLNKLDADPVSERSGKKLLDIPEYAG